MSGWIRVHLAADAANASVFKSPAIVADATVAPGGPVADGPRRGGRRGPLFGAVLGASRRTQDRSSGPLQNRRHSWLGRSHHARCRKTSAWRDAEVFPLPPTGAGPGAAGHRDPWQPELGTVWVPPMNSPPRRNSTPDCGNSVERQNWYPDWYPETRNAAWLAAFWYSGGGTRTHWDESTPCAFGSTTCAQLRSVT